LSGQPGKFLDARLLMKFAPVVPSFEEPEPYGYERFERCAEDVARRLLPRILPAEGGQLELLIDDHREALRGSGFVHEAIAECEKGWRAFFAARTVEVYAHGVEVRGLRGTWNIDEIESTARMLLAADRPAGVVEPQDEVARVARTLFRIVEQAKESREQSGPGQPTSVARALLHALEFPFPDLTRAARARLAAGLLATLAGIESSAGDVLNAEKQARARARKTGSSGRG